MKKGINFHSLPKGKSYSEYLAMAKEAGFDGIELATAIEGELNLYSDESVFTGFRKQAEAVGIELFSTISMIFGAYPPTSPDPKIREKCIQLIKLQIRCAKLLGASATLVVPGFVTEEVPYDKAYDRALEVMRAVAPEAEKHKIHVGIENVWNKFLLSPLEFRDFIDKIGSPYVKNYFDVGNFVYDGYPEQWISIMSHRICKVHIKDFKREAGNGNMSGFVGLLEGSVNFPKVMEALREVGYNDYITAEIPPYPTAPELTLKHISTAMDSFLGE